MKSRTVKQVIKRLQELDPEAFININHEYGVVEIIGFDSTRHANNTYISILTEADLDTHLTELATYEKF